MKKTSQTCRCRGPVFCRGPNYKHPPDTISIVNYLIRASRRTFVSTSTRTVASAVCACMGNWLTDAEPLSAGESRMVECIASRGSGEGVVEMLRLRTLGANDVTTPSVRER